MFIKLTLTEGRGFIWVNTNNINAVLEENGTTGIFCVGSNDSCIKVKECAERIIEMMSKN